MHTGVYKGQRQNLEKCQENTPVNQQPVRSQENIHCPRSNSSWETRRPSIVEKTQISKRHSAQSGLRHKRSAHSPVPRASIDQRSTQGWNPHRPTQNGESWQSRSTQPSSVSDSRVQDPLHWKYLHKWETRWNPSFGQAGAQSNPLWEKRCWCWNFTGLTSA